MKKQRLPVQAPEAPEAETALTLSQCIAQAEACLANQQVAQGIAVYQSWLTNNSSSEAYIGWFNLGALYSTQAMWALARDAYENSLQLSPDFAQARINLGLVLERQKAYGEAVRQWSHVVASRWLPHAANDGLQVTALNHMARLYEAQKNYPLAEQTLQQSLSVQPTQLDALQHWVFLQNKQCQWAPRLDVPTVRAFDLLRSTSPLAMLANHDDPAMQLMAAQNWVQRKFTFTSERLAVARQPQPLKMRIGYLSGDLCTHAVGLIMADLIEAHDRSAFEIYAFDYTPEDGSAYRTRLVKAFDVFVSIQGMDDRQAAQCIADHGIDVLIDMHGLSHGARPGILALHPAPHQGTYLGFIGTTAMPWIDFVITDEYVLPKQLTPFISEKPLYVEGSFIPVGKPQRMTHAPTRVSVGLPEKARVLACFNHVYKITEAVFQVWMSVLQQVDDAVLWLLDDNPAATQNLKAQVLRYGIDSSRVVFAPRTSYELYCQRLTLADVYLDTYPYNAGSTARDVIRSRVPMVTLCGQTMVSRMAASMLHSVGLDDLVTDSLASYQARVLQLAKGRRITQIYRKLLTQGLARNKNAASQWTYSLEQHLREMQRSPRVTSF
jgi:predicted O-linked N-acetylglucosamine transferase (SPINDLY family)